MRSFRGWRPALRIARREALRARGRSVLILVMIGLPVLGIVALDTLGRTSDLSAREGLDRQLGSSDAQVMFNGPFGPVNQSPTMSEQGAGPGAAGGGTLPTPDVASLRALLGPGTTVLQVARGRVAVRTRLGVALPDALGLDLRDPLSSGLFDLRRGRLPRGTGEAVVSERLASRGFPVGSTMTLDSGRVLRVVGEVESTSERKLNLLVADADALGFDSTAAPDTVNLYWLVSRPGGVDWATVQQLNKLGMYVLSRSVVEHPPPASAVTIRGYTGEGIGGTQLTVLALVIGMALIEVVLLAGPAFAVGARRQQRALALMVAGGAEPPHLRQVVLASGLVLGGAASVLGAAGGLAVAWLAVPGVQHFSVHRFGPYEFSMRDVAVIAACGLASALLASFLPAVLAGRNDVVAVLAGRRGETRQARWAPVAGGLLLAAGIAGSAYGARKNTGGELPIALAAVLAVLGVVLLTPLVLGLLGRSAGLLPLPVRFAVRDAARHRSRTAPAIAAVAATVAGVVALGIGGLSDAAQNRALYTPHAPQGTGLVQAFDAEASTWSTFGNLVHEQVPGASTTLVRGVDEGGPTQYQVALGGPDEQVSASYGSTLGSSFLVGPSALGPLGLSSGDLARARAALARGDLVVLDPAETARHSQSTATIIEQGPDAREPSEHRAVVVAVPGSFQPARAVLPAAVARAAGMPVHTTAMLVSGAHISQSTEDTLNEALSGLDANANLYVERGFHDDSTRVILLLLGSIGGVLVLGGTLTATFLALSDARPDFATMGAVGADPRTRRSVAAAYAATIGLVGAVLGAAVGFIPGIAVTYPLTASSWAGPNATSTEGLKLPSHFIDVPWLLVLGLVVALPLVTAVVVGLASRSRLPMVSRLS